MDAETVTQPAAAGAPPRRRRSQQRALDTRERILAAAADEFARAGFDGASTRAVADLAKLRHTLVGYHFGGKEGLWRAVMDRAVRTFTTRQRERLDGLRGVDDVLKLRLIFEDFVRYSAANLNLHRLMSHTAAEASPRLDDMVAEYLREYFVLIAELIASAQAKNAFVEGDPDHLHYLFIGAATRLYMLSPEVGRITGRQPSDPDFVDEHVQLCLALFFRTEPTLPA